MSRSISAVQCLVFAILGLVQGKNVGLFEFNKEPSKNWVVLVSGSNTWWNYRHQADVCHAYQMLRNHGIPETNIITMMYDDIAKNPNNPYPGKIFNDYKMKDVYEGVKVDYREDDVTPDIFLRVLKGDPELLAEGKKVLQTGPEDNVFVYFTDHGADGLIAFPSDELYAEQLNETVTEMFEKKRYKKLVFYIEACISGSMFRNILSDRINVYATTAANHEESSWATFCDHPKLGTCLADEYSYNWITNSESNDMNTWSLGEQYEAVRLATKQSHVMQYGDLSMRNLKIGEFQSSGRKFSSGETTTENAHSKPSHRSRMLGMTKLVLQAETPEKHKIAERRLHRAIQLEKLVKETVEDIMTEVKSISNPSGQDVTKKEQMACFRSVFSLFRNNCFSIQQVPEVAHYTSNFQQLCRQGYPVEAMKHSILTVCA